jgi:GNAT superfamily N-acetyltransferase
MTAAAGRTTYTTVALTPDGAVVAYTDLVVPSHDPGRAYQWGTLVAPEHRGHRLGLAVKAHNLRQLQHHCPDLRILSTFNAEVNRHMVEVNERLGFRPVERLGEFQRKLDADG